LAQDQAAGHLPGIQHSLRAMMSVMEEQWNSMDRMHWPEYNEADAGAYTDLWWDQSYFDHTAFHAHQQMDDNIEDWMCRMPKFPPPAVPAPTFSNSGLCAFAEAASELRDSHSMPREAMKPPPGLEVCMERSRPAALGVSLLMEQAAVTENKDLLLWPNTPATTAPPTPASSLAEFTEALSLPPTPAAQEAWGDWWSAHHVPPSAAQVVPKLPATCAGGAARVVSLDALVTGEASKVLSDPVEVRMEELIFAQPSFFPSALPAPPGLDPPAATATRPQPNLALYQKQLDGADTPPAGGRPMLTPPPGLELDAAVESPEAKSLEAVSVEPADVDGMPCSRAIWRIVHVRSRLKTSLGKPLVSPPFTVAGLSDLRFMITPDVKGTLEGLRGKSKQSHFAKMLSQGPLHCSIKLKVPELPSSSTPTLKFYLTVGSTARYGPYSCNFKEHTMHGCDDANIDWLKEVDTDGSLCVGLEMLEEA